MVNTITLHCCICDRWKPLVPFSSNTQLPDIPAQGCISHLCAHTDIRLQSCTHIRNITAWQPAIAAVITPCAVSQAAAVIASDQKARASRRMEAHNSMWVCPVQFMVRSCPTAQALQLTPTPKLMSFAPRSLHAPGRAVLAAFLCLSSQTRYCTLVLLLTW